MIRNHCSALLVIVTTFSTVAMVASSEINGTGGSFPKSLYLGSVFAYRFKSLEDPSYWAGGSTTGKCNIMGYWHMGNAGNPHDPLVPSSAHLTAQTAECTAPAAVRCGNYASQDSMQNVCKLVTPLVDFGASDSTLGADDYQAYPDLQMFPSVKKSHSYVPILT